MSTVFGAFPDDQLIRRSFYAASYGMCIKETLNYYNLRDLKRYFPSVQLPFHDPSSEFSYMPAEYKGLDTMMLMLKHLSDYHEHPMSKPEDHLRVALLAPLISDVISFYRDESPDFNLASVNE